MTKTTLGLTTIAGLVIAAGTAHADTTPQTLPFSQDWTSSSLITANDNWSGVPGVVGYAQDLSGSTTGVDPRTLTAAQTTVQVFSNISGVANVSGGVGDFDANVVALQGSNGADAPNIVVHLDTTGAQLVRLRYNLRDIDSTTDNSVQQFVVQYRTGGAGPFVNVTESYVADASVGPSLTSSVAYDYFLPPAAAGAANLQLRFLTTNAASSDEWLGIDDLVIEAATAPTGVGSATPNPAGVEDTVQLLATITPGTGPASTGITLLCDLSTIGGSAVTAFVDDGSASDDGIAGNNIFGIDQLIVGGTSVGLKAFTCTVSDAQLRGSQFIINLTVQPVCGNNHLEPGEGCDDGNAPGGSCSDGCEVETGFACNQDAAGDTGSASCASTLCDVSAGLPGTCEALLTCGNSLVEGSEGCDDGNELMLDGCDLECEIEDTYPCTTDAQCDSNVCDNTEDPDVCEPANQCGNSVQEGAELCDDGDTPGGCSDDCQLPLGGLCTNDTDCDSGVCDNTENPDVCEAAGACGNSVQDLFQWCDDGNNLNGDGCSDDCFLENGVACGSDVMCDSGICDETEVIDVCEAANTCGNGVQEGAELCDDGATPGGCSDDCQLPIGATCTLDADCDSGVCDNTETVDVCEAANACGNSVVEGSEACDDGGTSAGGGCSADCQREDGVTCTTDGECDSGVCDDTESPDVCEAANTCGNSVVEGVEGCDDGGTAAGGGCSADCEIENTFPCATDAQCDSGVCDNTETVDVCEAADTCGNSVVEGAEGCDDGGTSAGGGCSADCQRENGQACTLDAQCDSGVCDDTEASPVCEAASTCGNSVVDGGEGCDDGGLLAGNGCSPTCTVESGFMCAGSPSVCSGSCGDAVIVAGEECDDDGVEAGDGCDAACMTEDGWACTGMPSDCAELCGDGLIVGSEECDDAGTDDGDGCSSTCTVEPGWLCDGEPSTCSEAALCGDGVIDDGEECDDGDDASDDGCDSTCTVEDGFSCEGEPSACTADADGDLVPDADDNCPTIPNPSQADDDDDGAGNACDPLEGDDEPEGCCSTGDQGPTGAMVLLALVTMFALRRRRR